MADGGLPVAQVEELVEETRGVEMRAPPPRGGVVPLRTRRHGIRGGPLLAVIRAEEVMTTSKDEGRILVPALLWMAGVPFGIVLLLWLLFFRG